jgi:hypothetical protein|tara:strand:+ start:288 stop:662 length:375 start_codon:yes stop_codon:yes gene_type:complete
LLVWVKGKPKKVDMGMVFKEDKLAKKVIQVLKTPGPLSDEDLSLLRGSDTLTAMMRNRVSVKFLPTDYDYDYLLDNMEGFYYVRIINKTPNVTYQFWFENPADMDRFKKNLFQLKLGQESESQA